MNRQTGLFSAAMVLSVFLCISARAEEIVVESPHSISGVVALGTDAYWRGYSMTDNGPQVSAEIDYTHEPTGLYAGLWGGNIAGDSEYLDDFENWTYATQEGNLELDFYAGWWKELGPVELDLRVTYYFYPDNADSGLNRDPNILDWTKGEAEADCLEYHIGLAHSFDIPTEPTLSVAYDFTPEYFGEDGMGHHFNALLELALPFESVLAFEAGYQAVDGDKQSGCDGAGTCYGIDGEEGFDYWYYRVGLTKNLLGFDLDLSYHFGNSEEAWLEDVYGVYASDELIFTVSYSF